MISSISKLKKIFFNDAVLKRLSSGVFWMSFGTGVSKIFLLFAIILAGRLLGKTGFGELSMIRDTCAVIGTLAGLGLGITLVKFVAELRSANNPRDYEKIVGGIFAIGLISILISASVLFFGADILASRLLNSPDLEVPLRFGVLLFVGSAGSSFMNNAMIGMEMFRKMTIINITEGVVNLPAVIFGSWWGGVNGCIIGFALATCLGLVWQWIAFTSELNRRNLPISFGFPKRIWKILWTFSLPTFVASLLSGPVYWVVKVFMTRIPNGYAELGIYSAGFRFQSALLIMDGVVNASILPILLSREGRTHKKLHLLNVTAPLCIGLFLALPLMIFPELIQSLFGPDFKGRSFNISFSLIMFSCVILLFRQSIQRNMVTLGVMWLSLVSNLSWAVFMIVACRYCVRYGAIGIALGSALAYVLSTVILFPLFVHMHVLDRWIAYNRVSLTLWSVLVAACMFSVNNFPICWRALFLLCSLTITIICMRVLFRNSDRVTIVEDKVVCN